MKYNQPINPVQFWRKVQGHEDHMRAEKGLAKGHTDALAIAERLGQELEPVTKTVADGVVQFSAGKALTPIQEKVLSKIIQAFYPWKKGPFRLFSHHIDSEWRSDLKWDRLAPHIGESLEGKWVADIGCNNSYYLHRLSFLNPTGVVGFDPYGPHKACFQMWQHLCYDPRLYYDSRGIEDVDQFPQLFDLILCLGVLYHQRDPVSAIEKMHKALKPQGEIILECQGIDGDEPFALVPKGKYAGAKGVWFVPTKETLLNWMVRAGFKHPELFLAHKLEPEEQRRTPFADFPSLSDFLQQNDLNRTIEGYPAPWRFYIKAKK